MAELAPSEPTFPISDINLAPGALYICALVTYLKKKKKKERLQSCTNLYDPGQDHSHEVILYKVHAYAHNLYSMKLNLFFYKMRVLMFIP